MTKYSYKLYSGTLFVSPFAVIILLASALGFILSSDPPKGRIINNSECNSIYAQSISEPIIYPKRAIKIPKGSFLTIEAIGEQEDTMTAEVNGRNYYHNVRLPLTEGKNKIDFVITGEGEVHYWHGVIRSENKTIFEHQQLRLPARVCNGEIYRYQLEVIVN